MSIVLYSGWLSPSLCRSFPDSVFVFGDNSLRVGKGGQAVIRDEPNSLGVVTKRRPSMSPASFFSDRDTEDFMAICEDLHKVWQLVREGVTVIVPVTPEGRVSLGLERAELKKRAPTLYTLIQEEIANMVYFYGHTEVVEKLHC